MVYTTSREVVESEQMQNLGAIHFLSKPTNPEEIYYVLSVVLEENWKSDASDFCAF